MITYGDIFKEFCESVNTGLTDQIRDYRPCDPMFDVPFIPGGILVWLKNGAKIIYISKQMEGEK